MSIVSTPLCILAMAGAAAVLPLRAQAPALDAAARARRDRLEQPERVMDGIGLRPGMTVADIGAREGYYTIHLARRVGASGRVLAEDIDAAALDHLRERLRVEAVGNVTVIRGRGNDTRLPPGSTDVAFLAGVLCCADEPVPLLKGIRGILKPAGRLVILQGLNQRDHTPGWLQKIISDAGYRVLSDAPAPPDRRLIICEPT